MVGRAQRPVATHVWPRAESSPVNPSPDHPETTHKRTSEPILRPIDNGVLNMPRPPEPRSVPAPVEPTWPLDTPLLLFEAAEWTIRDACEGTVILGSTGGGKSSSSAHTVAEAFTREGFGGLIPTVKEAEVAEWLDRAERFGRSGDVRLVAPGSGWRFNFLHYLASHSDPRVREARHIARVFITIAEILNPGDAGKSHDGFWARSLEALVNNLMIIFVACAEPFSVFDLGAFVRAAPRSADEVASLKWAQREDFAGRIRRAKNLTAGTPQERAVNHAIVWWMKDFAEQPEVTRGGVLMAFSGLVDVFNSPELFETYCSDTTVTPEQIFDGALVVVGFPLKLHPTTGIVAGAIWKTLFQQAVERRAGTHLDTCRPVFGFYEEGQLYLAREDAQFQATCRSARCATVFITQNLPGLWARFPGGQAPHVVGNFLGNLNTLIAHFNTDGLTNQWVSERIGKSRRTRTTTSTSTPDGLLSLLGQGQASDSTSVGSEYDFNIPPDRFLKLRCGGPQNAFEVDAYVVLGPRAARQIGAHFTLATFVQAGRDEPPAPRRGVIGWIKRLFARRPAA